MELPTFDIALSVSPRRCEVKMNGERVPGVRGVTIAKPTIFDVPVVTLTIIAADVAVRTDDGAQLVETTEFGSDVQTHRPTGRHDMAGAAKRRATVTKVKPNEEQKARAKQQQAATRARTKTKGKGGGAKKGGRGK